jgi:hypothetical protein
MNKLIYIETTIPSFYTETRTDEETRLLKKWTRDWWHAPKEGIQLVTAAVVIGELERIPIVSRRDEAIKLITDLEQLEYTNEVGELAGHYISNKIMPLGVGDADHLALATWYGCDMLVTWNCRHLANPNKMRHLRLINTRLELATPLLVTPLELLGEQ